MLTDLTKFKALGANVVIYEWARIIKEEVITIGEGTQIDDFAFIYGGQGIVIGRYNHICSFTTIIGGGEFISEDYVGVSAGCRIVTGTQHYGDGKRMVPVVPIEQQEVIRGAVIMKKDSFLGSNAIIYPNVTIGEGAIVGAGAIVTKDVEPWTINVGVPARVVGKRPKVRFE
ncbi:MAG TPA: acyltransferase [Aggregatilineales bacterium]|nr:acyltransferase [Anaerolineales bacterium]HRE46502.1 acyltransferase [Aggregatilineales bacterium]